MSSYSKESLWTKDFILDTGINFLVYLIYYLLMVIIAVVAKNDLHASLAEAGLASGIFIVGTLIARLLAGQQIELFGRRKNALLRYCTLSRNNFILFLYSELIYNVSNSFDKWFCLWCCFYSNKYYHC